MARDHPIPVIADPPRGQAEGRWPPVLPPQTPESRGLPSGRRIEGQQVTTDRAWTRRNASPRPLSAVVVPHASMPSRTARATRLTIRRQDPHNPARRGPIAGTTWSRRRARPGQCRRSAPAKPSPLGRRAARPGPVPCPASLRPASRLRIHVAQRRGRPHPGGRVGRAQRGRAATRLRQVHLRPGRTQPPPHRGSTPRR